MTKKEATAKGKKLLKKMKGKGWKLRVHANIGWHYNVWNGPIAVYENDDGKVWCLMGTEIDSKGVVAGHIAWSEHIHSKDPNKVVKRQVRLARKVVDAYDETVKYVEALI